MRAIVYALLMFSLLVPAAIAQVPGMTDTEEVSPAPDTTGLDALIDIIEADPAGAALLERVRATAIAQQEEPQPAETSDTTIARQVAEYTRAAAEGISASVSSLGSIFGEVSNGVSGAASADYQALQATVLGVLAVGAGIFATLFALKLLSFWAFSRVAKKLEDRNWLVRGATLALMVVVDFVTILLSWAVGYFVALMIVGGSDGRMGINQTLLLNAFLLVETLKVVTRAVLVPRLPQLRMLPIGDTNAGYWSFWISRVLSLVGYTFMFVVPIVAANLSVVLASAVQTLVVATALVIGVVVVLQNKEQVRQLLSTLAEKSRREGLAQVLLFVARYWHVVAIAYLIALFVAWLANPAQALPFILSATLQTIIAIVAGMLVVSFIGRFVNVGIHLSSDINERLPLLESRLHAFVPRVMQIVRLVVLAGVVLAIAQAWSLFDFLGWITSEGGQHAAGAVVSAAIIVLIGIVAHVAMSSWVEYRLNPNYGTVPTSREKTLLSLFKNATTIALIVFVSMLALAQIGVNIAPLLAGAGVLGLAIGFGAQKFVQDIITGAFIQLENVMNEGDVVEAGGKSGVVERLTIRSVSIRDLEGTLHLIPFSSVDQVSNKMKGFAYHVAEIGIAYDSDIGEVKRAMHDAFDRLMETDHREKIIDVLDMQGITGFGDSAIMVRARIKTLPGSQWATGRAFSEFVKIVFDERGIEIPFPQVTMHAPSSKPDAKQAKLASPPDEVATQV